MNSQSYHIKNLIITYIGRLLIICLFNIISVSFAIFSFLLIEPFIQLIFQGKIASLNPIAAYLMQIMGHIVDTNNPAFSFMGLIFLIILLFLLKNSFSVFSMWIMAHVRSNFVRRIRNDIYNKTLILPISYFANQKKGDVISRAVNDTQEIEFTVLKSMQQFITEPLTIIFYISMLFFLNYRLTLFVLLALPLSGLVISLISRNLRKIGKASKVNLGELAAHVEESISGLRVIKTFRAQQHVRQIFGKHNDRYTQQQRKIHRIVDLASPLSEFLGVTTVMIILVFGGQLALQDNPTLTPALFIAYITLFSQIINPAKEVSTAFSNYRRGLSTLDRINEILDAPEVIEENEDALVINDFKESIIFHQVCFSYQERETLHNLNFTIRKGEIVALVGPSGAGKSTIVDLLPRFYDIASGQITVDGHDVRNLNIESLRSLYAIVSQDVIIFHDTIYENIAFGLQHVDKAKVIEAAKAALAYDFIMDMPQGFDSLAGDRGIMLSGGQRQRISIARAILRNSPILVLDEATSAMDSESEKWVQQAIDNVMKNRTVFVIAHRLSTIRNADKILVLDNGCIVESGVHEQLMQLNGKYAHFVAIQNRR